MYKIPIRSYVGCVTQAPNAMVDWDGDLTSQLHNSVNTEDSVTQLCNNASRLIKVQTSSHAILQ